MNNKMINIKSKKLILLEKILKMMATVLLWRHKPRIVGVTGSVGKTSAKEAIALVLELKYRVRKNIKNYNNEIGMPLTIIGAKSGEKSILKWFSVFLKWMWAVIFSRNYPEVLVLEMGVDRPKNMEYLLDLVKPEVGVITNISHSHLEYFKDINEIAKEKGKLAEALPEGGLAVLNADDENVSGMASKAKKLTFGFSECDLKASDYHLSYKDNNSRGIAFKLSYKGNVIPVRLKKILAKHQIYAAVAAIAVGDYFKINVLESSRVLEEFSAPCGRMQLIAGIKNTSIIDDSYNASAVSSLAALDTLAEISGKRKIAVLGDMLELGPESVPGHKKIGRKIGEIGVGIFVAVGDRMKDAVLEAQKNGFPRERVFLFSDPEEAGIKLQEILEPGDVALVKGSQGMRMEKVVEEVMAEPLRASELLCRQDQEWKMIEFKKP